MDKKKLIKDLFMELDSLYRENATYEISRKTGKAMSTVRTQWITEGNSPEEWRNYILATLKEQALKQLTDKSKAIHELIDAI